MKKKVTGKKEKINSRPSLAKSPNSTKTATRTSPKKIATHRSAVTSPENSTAKLTYQRRLKWLARWVGIPLLIYFAFFCFFTWPWITHFNGWFFTDSGDGLQNVWNMWWVKEALTELDQLPWHTHQLHYPYGVTLLGQTLNPFNGLVGIILQQFMSLTQAFNVMIIFSFVVGGLTTFWLCYYFTKAYLPSIIGGLIFTFSSYHFAHAIGHMQLVSLQWIPLFVLLWWKLITKPRYRTAVGASIALLLILLPVFVDHCRLHISISMVAQRPGSC